MLGLGLVRINTAVSVGLVKGKIERSFSHHMHIICNCNINRYPCAVCRLF